MKSKFLSVLAGTGLAFGLASATASAQTVPITFDPTGSGGPGIQVDVFDWAVGNALVSNVSTGFPLQVGTTFDLYAQAKLSSLFFDGNNLGIPGGQEFTFVLAFREVVTGVSGNTASFGLAGGGPNYFEIWADDTPDADDLTGSGFNDGTLILSGNIVGGGGNFEVTGQGNFDNAGTDNYGGQVSVTGRGASDLTVDTEGGTIDTAYFPVVPKEFRLSMFNNSQLLPFFQANPSNCFVNSAGGTGASFCDPDFNSADPTAINPDRGAVNGINGPDFQFQIDPNQSFLVPEPGTIGLLGSGLIALGALGFWRRRQNAAVSA